MGGDNIIHGNSENWASEVTGSAIPVLVDFWAEWCGPCRAMNPVLEALATELAGKLKIVKVNVDQNQNLAMEFGVRSIPTLLIFKGGTVKEQMVGATSKANLQAKISAHL